MFLPTLYLLSAPAGKRLSAWLAALFCAITLTACGTKGPEYDPTANWTAEQLFQDGKIEMNAGKWKEARDRFTAVEARYPFGGYAQQAMTQPRLTYNVEGQVEPEHGPWRRLLAFSSQYPNHPGTDYMIYLKGLINFTPPSAIFSQITQQDPGERDPKALRQSYLAFNELIDRFPNSSYAPDARKRIAWLVNTIAMNEVHVARFYYERNAYVAAINRAQSVITDFEGVPAAEQALYVMMMSYKKLGMDDLSKDSERVLLTNFPNTKLITEGFPEKYSKWNPMRIF